MHPDRQPDEFQALKVGRLRKLESLGLANEIGHGRWAMSENAEAMLRELSERGDIIKRIHRGLAERGIERGPAKLCAGWREPGRFRRRPPGRPWPRRRAEGHGLSSLTANRIPNGTMFKSSR
jgi:hypothetical protein